MTRSGPDNHRFGVSSVLFALLLFTNLPLLVNAQQQHNKHKQPISRDDPLPSAPGKETWVDPVKEDIQSRKPSDVRAIATIAPEGLEYPPVRAPPARSVSGLSSRQLARSLQDWEVEDIVLLATVDGTLHARDRRTGAAKWHFYADFPMIETKYHKRNKSISGGNDNIQEGFIWIIEPSQDGKLFGYLPGEPFGLFKLPWTIKKLVEEGAFSTESPPVVYTAEKKTHLYTVDAGSGAVLKYFTAGTSVINDQENCKPVKALGGSTSSEEECEASSSLILSRTEYTIGIQSRMTGEGICTIRYSEWGPNHSDKDLYNRYTSTKDSQYIYGFHDGGVFALDHSQTPKLESSLDARPLFQTKLDSPVARIFDVMKPVQATTNPDTPLVILPQPRSPYFNVDAAKNPQEQRLFVNCTKDGSWYALSEKRYPVITDRASAAPCTQGDTGFRFRGQDDPLLRHVMVGIHDVSGQDTFPQVDGPEGLLSIEPGLEYNDPSEPLPELPGPSRSILKSTMSALPTVMFTVLLCIAIAAAGLKFNGNMWRPKAMQQPLNLFEEPPMNASAPITNGHTKEESVDTEAPKKAVRFDDVEEDKENKAPEPHVEADITPPDPAVSEMSISTKEQEVDKPKKKAHRGKRGGAKKQANKQSDDTVETPDLNGSLNGAVRQSGKDILITPDVVSTPITEGPPDGGLPGLQNLIMRPDKVLGHGSGGTFVFEGEFEGRDVAVKRMLPQYFELASQEVSLLEQSEEHPNVIRYYCRREDENFLYIALERCQASLFDLFKEGRGEEIDPKHQALAQQIRSDPTKVLRQLAEGLRYLHNFRLVHRDIKPQNMLIAYPKKNTPTTFPRLVISDFGLCKTLPDNASTLIGTTGNAGTAGWKAPELIFQPKDIQGSQNSTNSLLATDSASSSAGVKRAVDIFSLGCVFFYVLSGGGHPFDDDEGWMQLRERNIKMNKANYHAVSMFGPETIDLIQWMVSPKPEDRPTAAQVLAHPFFWNAEDRLEFLSAASDRFDQEPRDGTSYTLSELESHAENIIPYANSITLTSAAIANATNVHHRSNSDRPLSSGGTQLAVPEPNFLALLDKKFIDTLGKQRKYTPNKLADLLRALRNKHHHWDDMPDDVKAKVGEIPEGYLRYWENKFPGLVTGVWTTVRNTGINEERRFNRWFGGRGG